MKISGDNLRLVADCRQSKADVERTTEHLGDVPLLPPPPAPVPPPQPAEPELPEAAHKLVIACRLALQMGDRSPIAYRRMVEQQRDQALTLLHAYAAEENERAREIGGLLHGFKLIKPTGLAWKDYLTELGMPWRRRRADEFISVFLGKTTMLKIQEKDAEKKRRKRAKMGGSPARPAVDSKQESGSACDINWEDHRESDDESDAIVRARAVKWQLHEAQRLAEEFALLRPGTQRSEIKPGIVRNIGKVIAAWRRLEKQLRARQRP